MVGDKYKRKCARRGTGARLAIDVHMVVTCALVMPFKEGKGMGDA